MNLGTYVCKGNSGHSVGRAWDWGVDIDEPNHVAGDEVIDWLYRTDEYGNAHAVARRLGVYYTIWRNEIRSSIDDPPFKTGRDYGKERGCALTDQTCRHENHIHFSLSTAGGAKTTNAYSNMFMGPDSVSWSSSEQAIFYRGSDNHLKQSKWVAGTWTIGIDLGGDLSAGPSAASPDTNTVWAYVRALGKDIFHKTWLRATGWTGWDNDGWPCTPTCAAAASGPDIAAWPNYNPSHLYLAVRGSDKALWVKEWDAVTGPTDWKNRGVPGGPGGGGMTSDPGAVSRGQNLASFFVGGTDNALYHKSWNPGGCGCWWPSTGLEFLGAPVVGLQGGPDAAALNQDWLVVFSRGLDNKLYQKSWTRTGGWTGWVIPLNGDAPPGGMTSDPGVHVMNGEIHVWGRGGDGQVWEKVWRSTTGWSSWGANTGSYAY